MGSLPLALKDTDCRNSTIHRKEKKDGLSQIKKTGVHDSAHSKDDNIASILQERALCSLLTAEWREKKKNTRNINATIMQSHNEDSQTITQTQSINDMEKQYEEYLSHKNHCTALLEQAQLIELNAVQAL